MHSLVAKVGPYLLPSAEVIRRKRTYYTLTVAVLLLSVVHHKLAEFIAS
jgi:hypothetical protein